LYSNIVFWSGEGLCGFEQLHSGSNHAVAIGFAKQKIKSNHRMHRNAGMVAPLPAASSNQEADSKPVQGFL